MVYVNNRIFGQRKKCNKKIIIMKQNKKITWTHWNNFDWSLLVATWTHPYECESWNINPMILSIFFAITYTDV